MRRKTIGDVVSAGLLLSAVVIVCGTGWDGLGPRPLPLVVGVGLSAIALVVISFTREYQPSPPKKYLMVYLDETDGDAYIEPMTMQEIKESVRSLDHHDYAIIDGKVVKGFAEEMKDGM